MPKKSNIDYLRDLCEGNDEALEFIGAVEEEQTELESGLKESDKEVLRLEYELRDREDKLEDAESKLDGAITDYETINLGLDTIHFTFESGNLLIRQEFDVMMQKLCKTPNALI